jgi:hypothetical protein
MMAHVSGNWSHRHLRPWMRSPCADTASSHGSRVYVDAAACVCSLSSKQYLHHYSMDAAVSLTDRFVTQARFVQ